MSGPKAAPVPSTAATSGPMSVAEFDALPAAAATELLRAAVASDAWLSAMVGTRPYSGIEAVFDRSQAAVAALDWPEVEQALAAHPRIGDRTAGADREAAWSREEQAGASGATDVVSAALRQGNLDYEQRFGHVFLICATGRSSPDMLAALEERLTHDPATEREVVKRELTAIARLRLQRILT